MDPLAPKQPFIVLSSFKIEEYCSSGILVLDKDMSRLKQSVYFPFLCHHGTSIRISKQWAMLNMSKGEELEKNLKNKNKQKMISSREGQKSLQLSGFLKPQTLFIDSLLIFFPQSENVIFWHSETRHYKNCIGILDINSI